MTCCPTCGRRHRPRRPKMLAPAPLLDWAEAQPKPKSILRTGPVPRLVLLPDCPTAEGEPRAGIVIPGRKVPVAFGTMAAAVAALRQMETAR